MTVSNLIDLISTCVVVLAIIASAAVLLATRRVDVALAVLLDLLTGAGLLHLAADPSYMRAVSAAIVLAIRRLVTWSLAGGGKSGPWRRPGPAFRFARGDLRRRNVSSRFQRLQRNVRRTIHRDSR
jgi:hypothetical protein